MGLRKKIRNLGKRTLKNGGDQEYKEIYSKEKIKRKGVKKMYGPQTTSSSIIHLICRYPILVVPVLAGLILGISGVFPDNNLPASMVTFCFDDGYFSTYEKAFPILEKYNYQGTVFVITSEIGNKGFMTKEQILELADKGWEIGSHSISHPDLTLISEEQLKGELIGSKITLNNLGLDIQIFASPYGRYNDKVIDEIALHYYAHRTAWPAGLNNIPPDNYYLLKSVSVEADTTVSDVKEWIRQAKKEKKWLILLFHHLDGAGEYNWSSRDFQEIVKYTHRLKFKGISMNEVSK